MNTARRFHRASSWLALLAVLAFTLLPTVSRAMAAATGGWTEVCTPQGMKLVALGDEGGGIATTLDACDHCTLAAHAPPPPPAVAPVLASAALAEVPVLFLQAPRRPFAWQPAQSRAPPARS